MITKTAKPGEKGKVLPLPAPRQKMQLFTHVRVAGGTPVGYTPEQRKRCEVYVGNLLIGVITAHHIRDFFTAIFLAIPGFKKKYTDPSPIREIMLSTNGTFAFVEFLTEELANTMVSLDHLKVEIAGRVLSIGRSQGYNPPEQEIPPLDIGHLNSGVIDRIANAIVPSIPSQEKLMREIYIGNLPIGICKETVVQLLTPALEALAEWNVGHGPPVLNVTVSELRGYAFCELQNEAMVNSAIAIFDRMELMGKVLKASRPTQADRQMMADVRSVSGITSI